jgi:UDP-2,4-diacetamido-2,4,6-trideoxy-beta-L-altropyranose hydrolase
MKIAFRVDASLKMGSGHLMRCLTLAEECRQKGAEVLFISRALPGHLIDVLKTKRFDVETLPTPAKSYTPEKMDLRHAEWLEVSWSTDLGETQRALEKANIVFDWLVVDHYALDERWETPLRANVKKIFVIDDLADRMHDADALLDQNFHSQAEDRYRAKVPAHCKLYLGPRYALLRNEFHEARQKAPVRSNDKAHVLIFFGGSDPDNATAKAVEAYQRVARPHLSASVVLGATNPHQNQIVALTEKIPSAKSFTNVSNMAAFMAQADIALGAAGTSTWERCCMGLPSLTMNIAFNQDVIAKEAEQAGVLIHLGPASVVTSERLSRSLSELLENEELRQKMSDRSKTLVDGLGTRRVAEALK